MRTERRPRPPVLRHAMALVALMVLAFMSVAPAHADAVTGSPALDRLFARLRVAPDAHTARTLEAQIWSVWLSPDDPDLAVRMADLLDARQAGDLGTALKRADAIVKGWPAYAEGWNQRATIEYMLGQADASLADITETLKREPRHFGAISGRILIELQRGKRARALKDMLVLLKLNPYTRERELFPELLPPPTRT